MHVLITDKGTPWQCHDHHGARSKDLLCNRILNNLAPCICHIMKKPLACFMQYRELRSIEKTFHTYALPVYHYQCSALNSSNHGGQRICSVIGSQIRHHAFAT